MRKIVTGLCAVALVAAGVLLFASAAMASGHKTNVCHLPPDNPTNIQLISVGAAAVPDHLAHGDNVVGPEVCDGVDNDCDGEVDEGLVCSFLGTCTCEGQDPLTFCFHTEAACQNSQVECEEYCEFEFEADVSFFGCSSVPSCPLGE